MEEEHNDSSTGSSLGKWKSLLHQREQEGDDIAGRCLRALAEPGAYKSMHWPYGAVATRQLLSINRTRVAIQRAFMQQNPGVTRVVVGYDRLIPVLEARAAQPTDAGICLGIVITATEDFTVYREADTGRLLGILMQTDNP